ncbi:DUF4258 domain-containing protein [Xanthomarina spongicola]|uniref:DUF4258 domain-containing protein n=1 Tax=Xanthomarina spongicola TaxID=570520 RepID=A0A316DPQ9_9FLAO|nr:DUF4258 domain-containing protein [Xanthomarina spongicola]PWK19955.1 hypothetical protein LX78_01305 [Xanthomarina spongicola]
MKLLHRVGYYLGGFSIGLIVLAFFLNGKKVSCDYGPEARVLKNINLKQINYSNTIDSAIINNEIDSLEIRNILIQGDINFSKSETRKEPCAIYAIEGELDKKELVLLVENCDSIATIQEIKWE